MSTYSVGKEVDGKKTYFFILSQEDNEIVVQPTKYLMHKMRALRSPNTIRRMAGSIAYYLTYCDEKGVDEGTVFGLAYDKQHAHFTDFLQWLKQSRHSYRANKLPNNSTCNAYLKDVFGYYEFLELMDTTGEFLKVLPSQKVIVSNAVGVRRSMMKRSFKGYLKEVKSRGHTIEKDKIMTLLQACTNCRDQVLLLLCAETGFRLGEVLGVDYTQDINYEKRIVYVNFRDGNLNGARAKNAEHRGALISPDTFELLLYYLSEYRTLLKTGTYLFVNLSGKTAGQPLNANAVYALFRRLEEKTGIAATPHMLRHYFANERRKSGWVLALISKAMGHRDPKTTLRYFDVELDELFDASEDYYKQNSHLFMLDELKRR